MLQLAVDSEEKGSTHLVDMVCVEEELLRDPSNQLGLIFSGKPKTLAGYISSLQLGESYSSLVEIAKAPPGCQDGYPEESS